jgi:hypothetical protein
MQIGIMKHTAGKMCLGSLYAGALWIECQTALLMGALGFCFAAASALALLIAALRRAPEGHERPDGFHARQPDRRRASMVRHIRFPQPARARQ